MNSFDPKLYNFPRARNNKVQRFLEQKFVSAISESNTISWIFCTISKVWLEENDNSSPKTHNRNKNITAQL